MATYTLTPNERDLTLCLSPEAIQDFDTTYPHYQPECLTMELDWAPFENEVVFVTEFKQLLSRYEIENHYDNLLYLILTKFDDTWAEIQHAYDDYEAKKRVRELAQLLLLLHETPQGRLSTVVFKTLTADAKLNDAVLTKWISKTLIQAITNKQYPPSQFGDAVMAILPHNRSLVEPEQVDYHLLKEVLKTRLINPRNHIKRGQFKLCMVVYTYLENGTTLRSEAKSMFSDRQLFFLFDLLVLLKQVAPDAITSEPQDYMRTFLMNFICKDK